MRRVVVMLALGIVLGLAACGDDPPPTQIVVVVTATPDPEDATREGPGPVTNDDGTAPATPGTPEATPPAGEGRATPVSQPAAINPGVFPTNVVAPLQVAEQVFQGGRMFWIRETRQNWVMIASEDDPNRGDWFCYDDTFEEGEPETDPDLVPPDDADQELYQPRRGFGKLWRTHPDLMDGLGWAITPEYEQTSTYTYIAGGYINEAGEYVPDTGEHRLTTFDNQSVSFFERDIRGDCVGGTWRLAGVE